MWSTRVGNLVAPRGRRVAVAFDSHTATYAEVIRAWQTDAAFRLQFNAVLADAPFTAFRWETPPVTASTATQPFECVLLDSPGIARRPDPAAFADHFASASSGVAVFANLGGDAELIVPVPLAEPSSYGHLAAFVRSAPVSQRHALWEAVGQAMARRVGTDPVWLNTAGAGVPWLHVRLDDHPKYYGFDPYRDSGIAAGDSEDPGHRSVEEGAAMKWYEPADPTPRHQCPCCGYVTLAERGMSLICKVCFWEDDAFVGDRLDEPSVCNHMTLRQGRANFATFGACDRARLEHVVPVAERARFVRRPLPQEEPGR